MGIVTPTVTTEPKGCCVQVVACPWDKGATPPVVWFTRNETGQGPLPAPRFSSLKGFTALLISCGDLWATFLGGCLVARVGAWLLMQLLGAVAKYSHHSNPPLADGGKGQRHITTIAIQGRFREGTPQRRHSEGSPPVPRGLPGLYSDDHQQTLTMGMSLVGAVSLPAPGGLREIECRPVARVYPSSGAH